MQRYFQKFGEVERCFHVIGKDINKYEGYGFVIFKAAATTDEVQRTRPHTIMGRVVRTRREVPEEEEKMKNKKLCFARVHGPQFGPHKDTSNSDLEDYFSKYGTVISVSQEREKGSGYIEFGDNDPVDWAVLVGLHYVKTAMLEVIRVQQEEIRRKCEQQKPTGEPEAKSSCWQNL